MGRGRKGSGVRALAESIQVRFSWNGKRCSENLKLKPTAGNLKFAEKLVATIKHEIAAGTFDYHRHFPKSEHQAAVDTFADYSRKWLKVQRLSKSTMSSYRIAVESFWIPMIGDVKLSALRYSDIASVLAAATQAPKTLNNYLVALRGVFTMAKRDGIVTANPADGVSNLSVQNPQPDPLTLDEVDRVLAYMSRYPEQVRHYFQFAFFTGLRTSELIALRWGDVDWESKTCCVCRAKVEGEVKSTKTNRVRYVDLNSRALDALQGQKPHTFMTGEEIFCNPVTRQPFSGDQTQRKLYWVPALKAIGLRHRDAYQTRHTYCTMLLMQGVNPAYVSKQMGHASLKMTLERYFRWLPSAADKAELDKLEAVIGYKLGRTIAK